MRPDTRQYFSIMTTLGPMLLFRLRTIWKTVDGKFYPTRLIVQTLPLLTTICSGRCRTPSLEYGSHQNRVSKIGLINSWSPSQVIIFSNCVLHSSAKTFDWTVQLWKSERDGWSVHVAEVSSFYNYFYIVY